jgi:hypothetical protein
MPKQGFSGKWKQIKRSLNDPKDKERLLLYEGDTVAIVKEQEIAELIVEALTLHASTGGD